MHIVSLETVHMKCQILFYWKNLINLSSAESAHSMACKLSYEEKICLKYKTPFVGKTNCLYCIMPKLLSVVPLNLGIPISCKKNSIWIWAVYHTFSVARSSRSSKTASHSICFTRAYNDVTVWSHVYDAHAELLEEHSSYWNINKRLFAKVANTLLWAIFQFAFDTETNITRRDKHMHLQT